MKLRYTTRTIRIQEISQENHPKILIEPLTPTLRFKKQQSAGLQIGRHCKFLDSIISEDNDENFESPICPKSKSAVTKPQK